jgi:Spy/CpxP family protein refolding chaperone
MKLKHVLAGVAATVVLASTAVAQPYGTGPGMMGGNGGGYGMGSGMMGGGYGMGHGMMFGYTNDAFAGLDLTPEQQKAIAGIQEQASNAMWQQMGTMHGQGYHMQGMFGPGPLDEAATRKSFQAMAETQKAMFELQLDARKKVDAVLTKDQREKLSRHWSGR